MNSDFSKRSKEERDLRITALILGELAPAEAEELRQAIAADAELAREYERHKQTIDLVRELTVSDRKAPADGTPLQLDAGRREKLLETFKKPVPRETAPRRRKDLWYVPMSIAAVLVGLLVATIGLPGGSFRAREMARVTPLPGHGYSSSAKEIEGETMPDDLARRSVEQSGFSINFANTLQTKGMRDVPARPKAAEPVPKVPLASSITLPAITDADEDRRVQISGQLSDLGVLRTPSEQLNEQPLSSDFAVERKIQLDRKTAEANLPSTQTSDTPLASPVVRDQNTFQPLAEAVPVSGTVVAQETNAAVGFSEMAYVFSPNGWPGGLPATAQKPFTAQESAGKKETGQSDNNRFYGRYAYAIDGVKNNSGQAVMNPAPAAIPPPVTTPPPDPAWVGVLEKPAAGSRIAMPATLVEGLSDAPTYEYKLRSDDGLVAFAQAPQPILSLDGNISASADPQGRVAPAFGGGEIYAGVSIAPSPGRTFGIGGGGAFGNQLGDAVQGSARSGPDSNHSSWRIAETVRGFYDDNPTTARMSGPSKAAGDASGRPAAVVQLPVLTNGEQLDRESSPTHPLRESKSTGTSPGSGPHVVFDTLATADAAGLPLAFNDEKKLEKKPDLLPATAGSGSVVSLSGLTGPMSNKKEQLAQIAEAKKPSGPQVTFANPSTTPIAAPTPMPSFELRAPASGEPASEKLTELSQRLEQLRSAREQLNRNISAARVETAAPKMGTVQVIEEADAKSPAKPTLWGRISGAFDGDVRRSARISVEQDMPDVDPKDRGFLVRPDSDRYDTRSEVQKIQSRHVLSKVIEKLKLNETWAGKRSGETKLSEEETLALLKKKIDVRSDPKTSLIDIQVKSGDAEEAARIANTIAEVYRESRDKPNKQMLANGLEQILAQKDRQVARVQEELARERQKLKPVQTDANLPKPSASAPTPQPEIQARENPFSTFSLNVSDVSFKLAAASLEKGVMPDAAGIRSEEFINAFDYRDPQPAPGVPIAFAWERARYPFAHNRDALRFSIKTAAQGREGGRPLHLVLLLDNSGSMERADRVRIIQESLRTLAAQLKPQDKLSVVTFARTASLRIDGVSGTNAAEVAKQVGALTPEGGTNLEDALDLAYRTALRHYEATAVNRIVLLTDGAANLGNVEPKMLKAKIDNFRQQGIALDCFGIGWEGFNDDLLEQLSRNGDGRYGFVNTPEEAATEFVGQLAGALHVAASDVKVQVEFNPARVTAYRQIGYAKHQLTKEQFRDNKVDAAEIGAAEAGNALYIVETNPRGEGPIATVRARFRIPNTSDYREHEWSVPFGSAVELEQSSPAMRLAVTASAFSEWLASSPFAGEVATDRLLGMLSGVPELYGADPRPKKLEWMIRQAKSISGK